MFDRLTWFRQFEEDPAANNFATLPTLADFALRLYESQDGTLGTQLALSDSEVDNVEHIYLTDLPSGEYTITVQTDTTTPYGIAWQSQLSGLPTVAIDPPSGGSGSVSLNMVNLVVGETYTLQFSDNLITWSNLHTVTAGSETEPFVQMVMPTSPSRGFYRIVWTP